MKIAVCMKRVPEMDVKFKIAASGKTVDETGLKWDMSDFDGYAVEVALREPQRQTEGHQPLLGTIVQVTLEATALVVPGREQSRATRLGLGERTGHLTAKPDDLHESGAPGGHLAQELDRRIERVHVEMRDQAAAVGHLRSVRRRLLPVALL